MNFKNDLTANYIRSILNYNSETGELTWKISKGPRAKLGQIAGCGDKYGYIVIRINDKLYKAHRLAWLWVTGEWPQKGLDHKNGITSDNSWENLREASQLENSRNTIISKDNTSGYKGICWNKASKKWQAQITINKKAKYLGCFNTKEEASLVYKKAALKYFGEFAKLNEIRGD